MIVFNGGTAIVEIAIIIGCFAMIRDNLKDIFKWSIYNFDSRSYYYYVIKFRRNIRRSYNNKMGRKLYGKFFWRRIYKTSDGIPCK